MAIIKAEVNTSNIPIPAIGDKFTTDRGEVGTVVMAFPEINDPNILVEVADPVKALDLVAKSDDAVNVGRQQHEDYTVKWIVRPRPLAEGDLPYDPGDTFSMSGATEEVRAAAHWGAGVFAACVDTGVDANHKAFEGKELVQWSPSNPGQALDQHGHGTFCLSELGGVFGILSDAVLGMFQGLAGPSGVGSELSVSSAIRACADHIARSGYDKATVSMSLGGSGSSVIDAAVAYLLSVPSVVVYVAAGNDGPGGQLGSPGRAPGVVVVGACDRDLKVAPFSTGGVTIQQLTGYQFDIVGAKRGSGDQFMLSSGTSMSTPLTAGHGGCLQAIGMNREQIRQYLFNHQHPLDPPATNKRGLMQLHPEDFGQEQPPPEPHDKTNEQAMSDALAEIAVVLDASGTEFDLALQALDQMEAEGLADPRDKLHEVRGAHIHLLDVATEALQTVDGPLPPGPDPQPPGGPGGGPPPPGPNPDPPTIPPRMPQHKRAQTIYYGRGPREYFNVYVPEGALDWPLLILWHGGGWLQGDPSIIPLDAQYQVFSSYIQQVTGWFLQQKVVVAEPAYDYTLPPALDDAYAAVKFITDHAYDYGADPKKLVLSGHSAGGHLAWMSALNPHLPAPKSVVSLAGACLNVDGSTRIPFPMTEQILNRAWGARSQWAGFSPHTHLNDRTEKLNGWVVQGTADDQLDPNWAVQFVTNAKRAGHLVDLVMVQGGNHFSVADPTITGITAQAFKKAFS
jgi:acetyl esterase/lipase